MGCSILVMRIVGVLRSDAGQGAQDLGLAVGAQPVGEFALIQQVLGGADDDGADF